MVAIRKKQLKATNDRKQDYVQRVVWNSCKLDVYYKIDGVYI